MSRRYARFVRLCYEIGDCMCWKVLSQSVSEHVRFVVSSECSCSFCLFSFNCSGFSEETASTFVAQSLFCVKAQNRLQVSHEKELHPKP